MKVSAVIITYNEEKNIERCLQSLEGIADEIVVVDSFSTDKTKEICDLFSQKIRFFQHSFEGYSHAKNLACSYATFPYLLSLDADELLSDTLKKNLIKEKQEGFRCDGYLLNRLTNYCGKWIRYCGWYPDRHLRLWKKELGMFERNIHETVSLRSKNIGRIPGDILHYSYYAMEEHVAQVNRFTTIAATDAFQRGKRIGLFMIFVKSLWSFFRCYIIKCGFLDGYNGFFICVTSSYYTFLKYAKLYKKQRSIKEEK